MARSTSSDHDDSGEIVRAHAQLPVKLQGLFSLSDWAESLVNRKPYLDPNPDYLSQILLMQTITAESIADVFATGSLGKLQEIIPDTAGAGTGNIEINDLYVTSSDFGEGAPCYVIITYDETATGIQRKCSTGATQVQAQLLRLLSLGVWPIRCQIKRLDRKDRAGRHLLYLFPPD